MEKAIRKAAYFMEKDGVFIFDLNTPYKHQKILAGETFDIEAEDAECHWTNHFDAARRPGDIAIDLDYTRLANTLRSPSASTATRWIW